MFFHRFIHHTIWFQDQKHISNANKPIFHEVHLKLISWYNDGDNNLFHGEVEF